MLFILSIQAKVKKENTFLKPLSIGVLFQVSPVFHIYVPESQPYFTGEFSGRLTLGFSAEYRISSWFSVDNFHSLSVEYYYLAHNYLNLYDNTVHYLKLHTTNLYYSEGFSLKFYFPLKRIKNRMRFMIRTGVNLEIWILSYYKLYDNDSYSNKGHLFDSEPDGPNIYGHYLDYRPVLNFANLGVHIGFGVPLYFGKYFVLLPELWITGFPVPMQDGNRGSEIISGQNGLIIRNDGKDSRALGDYKISLDIGLTLLFGSNHEKDSLYQLMSKKVKKRR